MVALTIGLFGACAPEDRGDGAGGAAGTAAVDSGNVWDSRADTGGMNSCSHLTQFDCHVCCNSDFSIGHGKHTVNAHPCVCAAGNCDVACASTFCADPPRRADNACASCAGRILVPGHPCYEAAKVDCRNDPECALWLACDESCPSTN